MKRIRQVTKEAGKQNETNWEIARTLYFPLWRRLARWGTASPSEQEQDSSVLRSHQTCLIQLSTIAVTIPSRISRRAIILVTGLSVNPTITPTFLHDKIEVDCRPGGLYSLQRA